MTEYEWIMVEQARAIWSEPHLSPDARIEKAIMRGAIRYRVQESFARRDRELAEAIEGAAS